MLSLGGSGLGRDGRNFTASLQARVQNGTQETVEALRGLAAVRALARPVTRLIALPSLVYLDFI